MYYSSILLTIVPALDNDESAAGFSEETLITVFSLLIVPFAPTARIKISTHSIF